MPFEWPRAPLWRYSLGYLAWFIASYLWPAAWVATPIGTRLFSAAWSYVYDARQQDRPA